MGQSVGAGLVTRPDAASVPAGPENEFEELTIRMLIIDRCLFLYTVDDDERVVRVLKFRHGSQLPGPLT